MGVVYLTREYILIFDNAQIVTLTFKIMDISIEEFIKVKEIFNFMEGYLIRCTILIQRRYLLTFLNVMPGS